MNPSHSFVALLVLALASAALADVYMHNPRGSNNRCDRKSNDRQNANRLFDSQNNNAGGYAISKTFDEDTGKRIHNKMQYYGGSELPVAYTSQHGCGHNGLNECNYVFQLACGNIPNSLVADPSTGDRAARDGNPEKFFDKDGITVNGVKVVEGLPNGRSSECAQRIPEKKDTEIDNWETYGKHESYAYYKKCKRRERNRGLFVAQQLKNGKGNLDKGATRTRQNPNAARYGFECAEERDYYPYWTPTPWVDLAVMTTNEDRCAYYESHSNNVMPRFECIVPGISEEKNAELEQSGKGLPINQEDCLKVPNAQWVGTPGFDAVAPQFGLDNWNFTCMKAPSSVPNHLGMQNGDGTIFQQYHWTIPDVKAPLENCVIRIRYNISVHEVPWDMDSEYNGENSPTTNDPYMSVKGVHVRLAVATNQFGRTFEDRSHMFDILPRPDSVGSKRIVNLNVAGKRGNIAQVRNCIEYSFIPAELKMFEGDFLHIQWDGSDYNPEGNDGEGRRGTDRSNLVEINGPDHMYPPGKELFRNYEKVATKLAHPFFTGETATKLAGLEQNYDNSDECFTEEELKIKKNNQEDRRNCALLNAKKDPYYNAGLVQAQRQGTYYLMSTRNNNFSNRRQYMSVEVLENSSNVVGIAVGTVAGVAAVGAIGFVAYKYNWVEKVKAARFMQDKI